MTRITTTTTTTKTKILLLLVMMMMMMMMMMLLLLLLSLQGITAFSLFGSWSPQVRVCHSGRKAARLLSRLRSDEGEGERLRVSE
jgi:hypothetical protein